MLELPVYQKLCVETCTLLSQNKRLGQDVPENRKQMSSGGSKFIFKWVGVSVGWTDIDIAVCCGLRLM